MLRPPLIENETLYGWITRYYIRVGVGHYSNTLESLLGCPKARIHPYLPNHIETLSDFTNTSSSLWLQGHTLYPLFTFFNSCNAEKLKQAMLGNESNVISQANIPHSKLLFEFGHRYCPICIANGQKQRGFGIIDIRHQIPGINVCPEHHCALNIVSCGDYGLDRVLTYSRFDLTVKNANIADIRFADFCSNVFEQIRLNEECCIDLDMAYQYQLERRGYLVGNGQLKYQKLVEDMTTFYSDFQFINGLESLEHFQFLGPLLRNKTHTHIHPVKHLIFANWLFDGEPNTFWQPVQPTNTVTKINKPVDEQYTSILTMLKSGLSMERVHAATGRSRCYIRRVCELNKIDHQSNACSNSPVQREAVITQAKLGRHRQAIADNLNLGLGYVEQVISNTPGLVAHRKKLWITRKIRTAYRELIKAKNNHPDWFRKDYKQAHNQAFFYLYHHAKRLLEKVLPPKLPPIRATLDWQKEDERLYSAISNLEGAKQLCISAIGHKVQDHAHLRRNLDRLPKTKALLTQLGKCQ